MTTLRPGSLALGPGREFERILEILRDAPRRTDSAGRGSGPRGRGVQLGPGDDAAVLSGGTVISTDLGIEGIHFHLDWISAAEAGYRTAAAGVSDLAAMGAEPVAMLASVGVPGDGRQAAELMTGVKSLLHEFDMELVGGDLARSPGPLIIDVVSLGWVEDPILRSAASVGDEVWVTGVLGGAAAAVALWKSGRTVPVELREAFTSPRPRVEEARWLAGLGVTAGIDLSDGLASDAAHVAAASGVGMILDAAAIPLDPEVERVESCGKVRPLDLALHGGDDFQLLVAAPPERLTGRADDFTARFGLALTRVGRVISGSGILLDSGEPAGPRPLRRGGFDHFSERAP